MNIVLRDDKARYNLLIKYKSYERTQSQFLYGQN